MPAPTPPWTLARIALDLDDGGQPVLALKLHHPHLDQLRQQGRQRAELAGLTAAQQASTAGLLTPGLTAAARLAEIERTVRAAERAVRQAELDYDQARDTVGAPLDGVNTARERLEQAKAALRDAMTARDDARGRVVRVVHALRRDIGEQGSAFEQFSAGIADAADRALDDAKAKLKAALAKVGPLLDDVVLAMSHRRGAVGSAARKAFTDTLARQLEEIVGPDDLDRLEREQADAEQLASLERERAERAARGQYVPTTIGY